MFFLDFVYSQLFVTPALPTGKALAGQTVIVTGSNTGLGLEATKHALTLGAEKVILAVRSAERGEKARQSILASTGRPAGAVEVWSLDLGSYASVQAFAKRAQTLERLDVVVENAGIATTSYETIEDNESTITVNVVSTFLLALLLLPKLRETANKYGTLPRLSIVASEVHYFTSFPDKNASHILDTLNAEKTADMADRYNVSKLLEVLVVRELAERSASAPGANPPVVINCLNPGLCHSELGRNVSGFQGFSLRFLKLLLARTSEVGSRTLIAAGTAPPESHGKYMSDGVVAQPSPFVRSPEGKQVGAKIWTELAAKLEKIRPGVTKI